MLNRRSRITTLWLGLLIATVLTACSNSVEEAAWQKINQGALLLDVRTPGEYNAGHLPNAVLIPVDQLPHRLNELGNDKHRAIVVYCKSGNRAGRAKNLLDQNGFTDVLNGGGYLSLLKSKPKP